MSQASSWRRARKTRLLAVAQVGDEAVAEDAVHPSGEVGAGDEAVLRRKGVANGILHEVFGGGAVAGERKGLDAELGHDCDDELVERRTFIDRD